VLVEYIGGDFLSVRTECLHKGLFIKVALGGQDFFKPFDGDFFDNSSLTSKEASRLHQVGCLLRYRASSVQVQVRLSHCTPRRVLVASSLCHYTSDDSFEIEHTSYANPTNASHCASNGTSYIGTSEVGTITVLNTSSPNLNPPSASGTRNASRFA